MKITLTRERIINDISQHLDLLGKKYLLIVDTETKRLGYLKHPCLLGKNVDVLLLEDFEEMKIRDTWQYTRVAYDVRCPADLLDVLCIVFSEFPEKIFIPGHII